VSISGDTNPFCTAPEVRRTPRGDKESLCGNFSC
jgi:hypothetical protein